MQKQKTHITVQGDTIYIVSSHDITEDDAFKDVVGNQHAQAGYSEQKKIYHISVPAKPMFAFMLRHTLKSYEVAISPESAAFLKTEADKVPHPKARLSEDQKRLEVVVPMIKHYRDLMYKVDAYPKPQGNYTVPVARAVELYAAVEMDKSKYPALMFSESALKLFKEPIPGFDGSVDSLKSIPLNVLNVITADTQSRKQRKASNKPLDEKFAEHGIENLYQLLFEIPRRYIDKSNPQKVYELEVGQEATIIGTVVESETFNSGKGLNLDVEIVGRGGSNDSIRVSFFAGAWMQPKFKVGSEVIVTGKYKPWRDLKQITGSTIEFVDSASALPITPIYSQSEKKGITTVVVMRVMQELIARLGDVELPFYLRTLEIPGFDNSKRSTYTDLIKAVHFPESMEQRETAIKQLAFYELVEMQVVVQSRKHEVNVKRAHTGLSHKLYADKAYASAVKNLPFKLTGSQKKGIQKIAEGMEEPASWQGLLSADVGAGKGLPENEVVLTPKGFIPIKDIKVGDRVVGRDGKPTEVIGVFPQGEQEVARITFSDKTSIVTDLSHLWELTPMAQTSHFGEGPRQNRVISTGQLLSHEPSMMDTVYKDREGNVKFTRKQKLSTHFKTGEGKSNRWKLPLLSSPVEYEISEDFDIDPYLLGYWLGDGSSYYGFVTVWKEESEEVYERLSKLWHGKTIIRNDSGNNKAIGFNQSEEHKGLSSVLASKGLLRNKHIPLEYLQSSPQSRLALIQGLLDSDGYITKRGTIDFCNTNESIVSGIADLVRSLGGVATVSSPRYKTYKDSSGDVVRTTKASYIVSIDMPFGYAPFRLNRKVERYSDRGSVRPKRAHSHRRAIVNVKKLPEKMKTICIKVAAEDELFVTKDFLVTHNTVVATLSSLIAIDSGYQAAILAPTEILARQLYESFVKTRESIEEPWKQNVNIVFYTGSMKAKEKREILAKIKSGEANVIVSTQAAMTGAMEFRDLGFVAIDEQQKFGAEQRSALLSSRLDGRVPDVLQMTATPIPRSVSQVFYGDMDFISLTDKPEGRLPITTEWVEEPPRTVVTTHVHRIWEDLKKEIAQGRKAFVIAPLVEDSSSIDASSVEATYKHLRAGALTGINIGFVHGKMKAEEARQKMLDFKNGVYDVLVASTIIEVGVDIKEATRMVVLSADRLGASSLHQIRGRIGRNSLQSKCYLIAADVTDNGGTRLQALVDSNDGFEIAKNDLLVRSEGSLFGTSQSGKSEFQFLKLARHGRWITHATEAAQSILDQPFGQAAVEVCKEKFGAESSRVL